MVRIEIKNFQSIDKGVVEIDGFSALAGRSNIGKSAIVRAIRAALTGSPADSYVRHEPTCPRSTKGAKSCKCYCSVHIVGDGLDLLWEKGDTVNRYVHNGTEYTVVGRGTPEFLMQDFAPVKLGSDDKEVLQVSDQFKPIFILNKPGTVAADILSDVAKLDQINVAMRLAEKDRKEAKATRNVREKDVLDLDRQLAGYVDLDGVVQRVAELENLDNQTEDINTKVQRLERFITSVLSIGHQINDLKAVNLIEIPVIEPVVTNGSKFIALEEYAAELSAREGAVSSLDGLEDVELPNIEPLLDGNYEKLIQWALKVDSLRAFFGRFQKFNLVSFPELGPLEAVEKDYSRFASWASRVYAVSQSLLQGKKDLSEAEQEEVAIVEEFKKLNMWCPTCNRPLGIEHSQCLE